MIGEGDRFETVSKLPFIMPQAQNLEAIQKLRKEIRVYFYLSTPGAIATIFMLTFGNAAQQIIQVAEENKQPMVTTMLGLVVAFACWLYPFEESERRMTKMKRLLAQYVTEHGSHPIHYTHVERFINTFYC